MVFLGGEVLGLAGVLLVVIGWIFEVRQIIKTQHSSLDWNFGTLYLAGSILLVFYSISINSWVFALLNALAALLALFGLWYKWAEKRQGAAKPRAIKTKRRRKRR